MGVGGKLSEAPLKLSVKKLAQKSRQDCMEEVNALFSCFAVRSTRVCMLSAALPVQAAGCNSQRALTVACATEQRNRYNDTMCKKEKYALASCATMAVRAAARSCTRTHAGLLVVPVKALCQRVPCLPRTGKGRQTALHHKLPLAAALQVVEAIARQESLMQGLSNRTSCFILFTS